MKIIEKEVGEGANIDDILKDPTGWKGRAQKIEMLKAKVKKLKLENGDSVSTTTFTSEFSAPKTHAEKNLETIGANRARELDKLKEELVETRDKHESLKEKYKGACARKTAVENEMKELKNLMQSKLKILLDKSENDDKLINALKEENSRLQKVKSGKATVKPSTDSQEKVYSLQSDINKLKSTFPL